MGNVTSALVSSCHRKCSAPPCSAACRGIKCASHMHTLARKSEFLDNAKMIIKTTQLQVMRRKIVARNRRRLYSTVYHMNRTGCRFQLLVVLNQRVWPHRLQQQAKKKRFQPTRSDRRAPQSNNFAVRSLRLTTILRRHAKQRTRSCLFVSSHQSLPTNLVNCILYSQGSRLSGWHT